MRFASDMMGLAVIFGLWPFIAISFVIAWIEQCRGDDPLVSKSVAELSDDVRKMIWAWFPGCRFI